MFTLQCVVLLMSAATYGLAAETGYIKYYPGTLNVILSAPHGGDLTPVDIPDRDYGCYIAGECVWSHNCGIKDVDRCKATIVTDSRTWQLTLELRKALYKKFGRYPHVVVNKLKRTKLDPNREKNQAAFNETDPGKAWEEYHGYLDTAKAEVSSSGPGILFDIHGHGRPQQWVMVGNLITGPELKTNTFTVGQTSIKALVERQGEQHFEAILRGAASFGAYLVAEDFDAVPSPVNPDPNGATFYRGGYITVRHGSRDGGIIDAIQIESASTFRKERFDSYVEALATAIHGYVGRYYPLADEEANTMEADIRSGTSRLTGHWSVVAIATSAVLSRLLLV